MDRPYQLRADLARASIGDFQLPLGFVPAGAEPPTVGYTVEYIQGEDEEPDTYAFYIVVSHERVAATITSMFEVLPDEVCGIVEIGSRDAYRAVDVYMSPDPIPLPQFLAGWREFDRFFLEDSAIAVGANSEEPFVEVFLDQWKGVSVHVPPSLHDEIRDRLLGLGVEEVEATWPDMDEREATEAFELRSVLDLEDEFAPGLDEILLVLRRRWELELNIDPAINLDEGGRELGVTLWHAMVLVEPAAGMTGPGGYASVWATARSQREMEELARAAIDEAEGWSFDDIYTIDRVAYDERPDELANLPPVGWRPQVHLVSFEA